MKYLKRSVKYFLFLVVFFSIFVSIMFYTSTRPEGVTIFDMFKGSELKLALFFIGFAAVYPLVGYSKRAIHVSNIAENKDAVIELFKNAKYYVESDSNNVIVFRLKSPILRLFRTYEDSVTIDFSNNPATIEGLRKDVLRFARGIEYICQKSY